MSRFKFPKVVAFIANVIVRAIVKTCKIEVAGLENLTYSQEKKQILMLWHNRLIITPELLHRITPNQAYAAVVSSSRDGELLARMIGHYEKGSVIRVPHDLKHEGLRKMVKTLREKEAIPVITPDGPRGPKYKVKGGIVLAAKNANAVIIPFSWNSDRAWTFKTWDRLNLPKPFSTLKITFGNPIDLKNYTANQAVDALETSLNSITA